MKQFLVLILAFAGFAASADQYTYTFGDIHSSGKFTASHDEIYVIEIKTDGTDDTVTSVASLLDLAPVEKTLGVNSPEELSGKSFSSIYDVPMHAFERMRLDALHGGHYVAPSPDQFFVALAKGLVEAKCPRVRDIADKDASLNAVMSAFDGKGIDAEFVRSFDKEVQELSHGSMSVAVSSAKSVGKTKFSSMSEYFVLNQNGKAVTKFALVQSQSGFACSQAEAALAN